MDVRRILIIGVGSALAIFAVIAALPAEGDPLIATVGKPAIVTAAPAKPQEDLAADKASPRVVVHVTGGDTAPRTADALPDIVERLRPRGFSLVTVTQLLDEHP